ncbi:MAG: hypothetical protein FE048_04845 [Thermoplasmata archaeon]|nr:MAG: hypothetical protein FE048_04845 [Thermoplasmata archaeon]
MAKYLKTKWFGVFLFDEKGVKEKKLFPKDAQEIANRLMAIQKGEILEEEKEIAKDAYTDEIRLKSIAYYKEKIPYLEIKAETYGYKEDLLKEASNIVAIEKMKKEMKGGRRIVQAIDAIDDINKTSNIILERLKEWYEYFSLEIPEGKKLAEYIIHEWKEEGDEINALKSLANLFLASYETKEVLEKYVKKEMKNIAPNLSKILGETLGARLIACAKGLKRLAMMPAGTVQVLGAERALFRHIKEGTLPPKHGILFQHELVNKAPKEMRGKIARSLAAKVAIAAKADVFTKHDIAEELKKELGERIKEIKRK